MSSNPFDAITSQLDEMDDHSLYDLSCYLLASVSEDLSATAQLKIMLHVIVVQDYLLKRVGFGSNPKPNPSYSGIPKYSGPTWMMRTKRQHERDSTLTHNPFKDALKKKD
jgi:hypothetical protein